jgi:hypothetical protein
MMYTTSVNIIFKVWLLSEPWSAEVFQRGIPVDNPFGVHEYRNVM